MKAARIFGGLLSVCLIFPFASFAHAEEQQVKVEITSPFSTDAGTLSSINFSVTEDYLAEGTPIAAGQKYVVSLESGVLNLYQINGDSLNPIIQGKTSIVLTPANSAVDDNMVELDGDKSSNKYRESMEFRLGVKNGQSCIIPINELSVDNYLKGVVPMEMSDSWEMEALKAQAVAARTYVMKSMQSLNANGYINDTVKYQAYRGVNIEGDNATQAVEGTKGEVLTYNGQLISALYSSSDGGYTESSENVWSGGAYPYLTEKPDPYDAKISPHIGWQETYTIGDIEKKLAAAGMGVGTVKSIQLAAVYPSHRIADLVIQGDKGTQHLSKERARTVLGLKSAMYTIKLNTTGNAASNPDPNSTVTVLGQTAEKKNLLGLSVQTATGVKPVAPGKTVIQGATGQASLSGQQASAGTIASVTFTGNGWGHGVGMSQWGAREMAKEGKTFAEILDFYYQGAVLTQNDGN
ncbi:SpoIID/LytB domain-containing protein [Aneurinibacillus terranovensis]|uniref:SpoIID/LytB domain-containing protein n=1 Tax=Aneurinibacillus terranovensis TaxID=278991 RepID=UPI0004068E44|nr:SpoIID/LytB domain-containing protein [Aneurinibacillus terranovensis]